MPKLHVAEDLEELLDYHIHFCSNEDIDGIWESQGEKVLFILDGWDELPLLCRHPDSFLPRFINGHFLPKCNVIVTSRQLSTLDIRQYSNRIIHVVGYTNAQIQKYIHLYFEEANVAEKLVADLQAFPNVMNTYHIVVNLAIVCFVYEADGMKLPTTACN